MTATRLTCPRVEVGLGLRREFQNVLDWAEKAGCYVNYVKIPAFLQNIYIDLVIEGDSRYTVPICNWMKQLGEE